MDRADIALSVALVEDKLVVFYRLDNGERLLLPGELAVALKEAETARQAAETVADREKKRADELAARLALYEKP